MKAILEFIKEDFEFELPKQSKEFRKAVLKYQLTEEESEFKLAINGSNYYCALWEIKNFIRTQLKHGVTMTDEQLLEHIRDLLPEDMD